MSMETFFGSDVWYKDGYFWRAKTSDGSNGKGDLIYNTCGKIAYDKDKSPWAKISLLKCFILLWARKRWPDDMPHYNDAKHWFGRVVNRSINKITSLFDKIFKTNIRTHLPFRAQGRMSRDPFIAFYTACAMQGDYRKIELITIPRYLYRPNTFLWRKFLIKGGTVRLKIYGFLSKFSTSKKAYVNRLREERALAIEYKLKIITK